MTSNISKLNNNNFHPESSIYMNSLRRHLSRIVIFPACAPKQSCHHTHPRHPRNHQNFSFLDFYALRSFYIFFFLHRTYYFLREMCMANGQEWGVCMAPSPHRNRPFVCLFVCQASEQTKKEAKPHTAIAYTQLTLLRSKWGRSACIRCFHTQSRTHHSMPFLITRQVHSSI